jgi:transaldolase
MKIKLFADGADIAEMVGEYKKGVVKGFTTNPTLMRKAGVTNYVTFAQEAIRAIPDLPISFEVFSDDIKEMEREARIISSWGKNVYVKIPIMTTTGGSTGELIRKLSKEGVKLNVTAIMTVNQVRSVVEMLDKKTPAIISVFAGRIADTGKNPVPVMAACSNVVKSRPNIELLWASTRELYNLFQAEGSGCHIITITPDILKKMSMVDKDLDKLSQETVLMFYNDAKSAGYTIP